MTAIKAFALSLAVVVFFGFAGPALAQQPLDLGLQGGSYIGLSATDPRILVANIIRIALGLLGTIALVIILYAGFLWMTAAGDAKQIDRAKRILTQALIGLVIIVMSFAIASFVIARLLDSAGGGGVSGTGPGGGSGGCIGLSASCPSGALGSGIIESTYPVRNATGIPRNTRIVVTFKSKIDPASVVVGGASPSVAIIPSSAISTASNVFATKFAGGVSGSDIAVTASPDGKTFTFSQPNCTAASPGSCIGNASQPVFYTVALGSGIKLADGGAAFTGTFSNGYLWEFQVSSVLDVTPPKVIDAFPLAKSTGNPRNSLIHIDFSEAMDPVSLQHVAVTVAGGTVVPGTVLVGAGYTSAEFRSNNPCGINSCGETIYCLPASADISVTAKACTLSASPPGGVIPPDGLTDMAGNSLDGDGNGTASGPGKDDYAYAFSTGSDIDLTPPKITDQQPAAQAGNIARDVPVTATFSKLMSSSSITTDTARLIAGPGGAPINYWVTVQNLTPAAGATPTQSQATVVHGLFDVNQPYATALTSGIRDLEQNCFFPSGGQSSCTGGEPFCCNGVATASESDWQARCGVTP